MDFLVVDVDILQAYKWLQQNWLYCTAEQQK